jgi:hypothetical protein
MKERKFETCFADEWNGVFMRAGSLNRLQILKAISIAGAIGVGLWLPFRLIGFVTSIPQEIAFDLFVLLVSSANLILIFEESVESANVVSNWFRFSVLLDLACLTPVALSLLALNGYAPSGALVINFLLVRHVRRIKSFLDDFGSLQPTTYRLVPLVAMLPLLVHFAASGWIALGSGSAGVDADHFLAYSKAFYWAFSTLTTVGYGDIVAITPPQMFFACTIQLIGVGVFGYILSNVASLLSRSDAAREHHMDNLDRIETFMKIHTIPSPLRLKIRDYYHYLWKNKKGYQDRSLLDGLPAKIQSELFVHINRAIIEKVPLFRGASENMIEDLMNELEPRIFVPDERVFRIDEPGDALFFIQSGEIDIVGRDGKTIVVLREGSFFGEMALISAQPRNATAVANGFCDLYVLHRTAFDRATAAYPEFREHMESTVNERRVS